jgi:hypothetical protein
MKLFVLVVILAFVFIITYNPRKPQKEMFQEAPGTFGQTGPTCDSRRYLELQGFTGEALGDCKMSPIESGGVIFYA